MLSIKRVYVILKIALHALPCAIFIPRYVMASFGMPGSYLQHGNAAKFNPLADIC